MSSAEVAHQTTPLAEGAATPVQRIRRTGPQLLSDELLADELLTTTGEKKGRVIEANSDLWSANAWCVLSTLRDAIVDSTRSRRDRVDWDDEQEAIALAAVEQQANVPVPDELRDLYNANPAFFWDSFYANMKGEFLLWLLKASLTYYGRPVFQR